MNVWDRRPAKPCGNCELKSTLLSQHSRRVEEIRNLILCVSIGKKKPLWIPVKWNMPSKQSLLPISLSESNLCLVPWASAPSSNQSKIFTSRWNVLEFTPSQHLFLPAYLIIFHLEQETGGALRWFLQINTSLTSGRGGLPDGLPVRKGKVKAHCDLGCLPTQPSPISQSSVFPDATQITMSSRGIEKINDNEAKESSSKGIWKVLFYDWLNEHRGLSIGRRKKSGKSLRVPLWGEAFSMCIYNYRLHYSGAPFD